MRRPDQDRLLGHRRLDVQGLRAVAVLVVIAYHAGLPVPGGFIGVDVFFVISGFVITAMLSREWEATGRIDIVRFYSRRFRRLTPALAVMVSLTLAVSALVLSPLGPQQVAAGTGLGAMAMLANVVIASGTGGYFDDPAQLNPLLHTWSLSVEEQFYLVFPLLLLAGWALARKWPQRMVVAGLVGGIGIVSFAVTMTGTAGPGSGPLASAAGFYSPLARAWEFACGAGVALFAARRPAPSGRLSTPLGMAGALMLAASLWVITGESVFPGAATTLPVLATVLLVWAGHNPANPVSRLLSTRPMVRVGDWSYSLYLWHWPFICIGAILRPESRGVLLGAALVSGPVAAASYRWVEQPLRQWSAPSRQRFWAVAAVALAVPASTAAFVAHASANGYWDPQVVAARESRAPHAATLVSGCLGGDLGACRWHPTAAGQAVYLIGDSHAGHFGDAVVDAAGLLGRPAVVAMQYNCPFVPGLVLDVAGEPTACLERNEDLMTELTDAPPGTVVIAGADTYWYSPPWSAGLVGEPTESAASGKLRVWSTALTEAVEQLQRAGHTVLLVHTVPLHERYKPELCSVHEIRRAACSDELPIADAERVQGPARELLGKVATQTGARTLDLWPFFCGDGVCRTQKDGLSLYLNWSHISVPASRSLAGQFAGALQQSDREHTFMRSPT